MKTRTDRRAGENISTIEKDLEAPVKVRRAAGTFSQDRELPTDSYEDESPQEYVPPSELELWRIWK